MKTPMQEMLEWVRATLPMDLDWPRMIEEKVESLIEKEKEEIEIAYYEGNQDRKIDLFQPEVYYYQRFGGNNEQQ